MSSVMEQGEAETLSASEAFRMRMESQCQQIHQYRHRVEQDTGRRMTLDEAAMEWIKRYAATYDPAV